MTYGECYLPGRSSEEVLFLSYLPSVSGERQFVFRGCFATFLARFLSTQDLRYSYYFLFAPGTIGAITWLAQNREKAQLIPAWV